jgi:serine/threonine protein kinase
VRQGGVGSRVGCWAGFGGVASYASVALLQSLHMLCDPGLYDLRPGTAEFEHAAQELRSEAQLLQSLHHRNIVAVHGVTMHPEHGHLQWLVTELADGGSLESWLAARGRMTLEELLDLLRSIMRALVYLRGCVPTVIHRDIKPANVLVFTGVPGGIVWKLGDVGIAKVLEETLHARTSAGTPMYMAPDVVLGPYTCKVDVFSTAVMAAELVVRYMDIVGFERVAATQYRRPEERPALVADACARLDTVCPQLSRVVRGCSAMMPGDRMSCLDALDELEAIVEGGGGVAAAGAGVGLESLSLHSVQILHAALTRFAGSAATAAASAWETCVGLEIHAQIRTSTKLFSGSAADVGVR